MKTKTAFESIIEDLTPEEKQALKKATAPQWMQAIQECVNDPQFWNDILTAFVAGAAEALEEKLNERK